MFGYVRPSQHQLSEQDRSLFSAAYCGLCRTLGERYGLSARFILNYDLAFLAILLAEGGRPEVEHHRCVAHPIRGRDCCETGEHLELAADCSVILAWWQLQDEVSDHSVLGSAPYRVARTALAAAYEKAARLRPEFDESTREHLRKLRELEEAACPSMDAAADAFACLLSGIAGEVSDGRKARVLEQLLYHLGRWIYLVDAADDLSEDHDTGNYNVLIHRFALTSGELTGEARQALVFSLDNSIRHMAAAFELWDFGVWTPIIRSTVYEGLYCVGNAVLEGTFRTARGLRGRADQNGDQL